MVAIDLRRWTQKKAQNDDDMERTEFAQPRLTRRQILALVDLLEDSPEDMKRRIAPVFRYEAAQWFFYDVLMECEFETGEAFHESLEGGANEEDLVELQVAHAEGRPMDLSEEWSWDLLMQPAKGVHGELSAARSVAQNAKRAGTDAYKAGKPEQALARFSKGLRALHSLEKGVRESGPMATIHLDLLKRKALVASGLQMPHTELRTAEAALVLSPQDAKAWYRKANALEQLGQDEKAQEALQRAGLPSLTLDSESLKAAPAPPRKPGINKKFKGALSKREIDELRDTLWIELGMTSLRAVDFVTKLKRALGGSIPVPTSLVLTHFSFGDFLEQIKAYMMGSYGAGDNVSEALETEIEVKAADVIWGCILDVLGYDPRKLGPQAEPPTRLDREQADKLLDYLQAVYSGENYKNKTRVLAKSTNFDMRSFLTKLRPVAMEVQGAVLVSMGFDKTDDGLQKAEAAIMRHANYSKELYEKVCKTREAAYGGPNGLYTVFMDEQNTDCRTDFEGMEARAQFLKRNPF